MSFLVILSIMFIIIVAVSRLWIFRCKTKVCMVGKTVLLVGGVSGIGYQTALDLASRGCRLIIADVAGVTVAVKKLKRTTHNPHIYGRHIDLTSFASIRNFVEEFEKTESKLDLLINNSGVAQTGKEYTVDGLDVCMQINYYGHFLLIHLLIDLLKKSAPSRIVVTSSLIAHLWEFDLSQLNPKNRARTITDQLFEDNRIYFGSKFCLIAASRVFAKKVAGTGITINAYNPGAVATSIFFKGQRDLNIFKYMTGVLTLMLGKTPEEGAQTLIHLACSDEVKNASGQFFVEGKPFFFPVQLYNWKVCEEIWEKSIQYTGLRPQEVQY